MIGVVSDAIVIGGVTLTPGVPGIEADGQYVSLGTNILIVGDKTETFSPLDATIAGNTQGIGALVMSGIGAVGGTTDSSSNDTAVITFQGAAPSERGGIAKLLAPVALLVAFSLFLRIW